MDNSNSDEIDIPFKYWKIEDKNEVSSYLEFNDVPFNKNKKLWKFSIYDLEENRKMEGNIRLKKIEDNFYIFQTDGYANGRRGILLYPIFKKHDDEYYVYEFSLDNDFKNHPLIKKLGNHVTIDNHTIEFDGYASSLYSDEILEYIKDMNKPKNYIAGEYFKIKGYKTLSELNKSIKHN